MTLHVSSDDTTCTVWWHYISCLMTLHILSDDTTCRNIWHRNNSDSATDRPSSCLLDPSDEELEGRPSLVLKYVALCCSVLTDTRWWQLNVLDCMWLQHLNLTITSATVSLVFISLTKLQLKNVWCLKLPRQPLFPLQIYFISLGLRFIHPQSRSSLYPHSHAIRLKPRHFNDKKLSGNQILNRIKNMSCSWRN